MNFRKIALTVGATASVLSSVMIGAAPASAGMLSAPANSGASVAPILPAIFDCTTGSYGKNNDGVWVSCNRALGGDARGRGDCTAAPDIYTSWIHTNGYAQNGFCLFSMRDTQLETRIN